MSIKWRQVAAILTIFKYKYLRDLATPIKDYLFPIAIALGTVFLCTQAHELSVAKKFIFFIF